MVLAVLRYYATRPRELLDRLGSELERRTERAQQPVEVHAGIDASSAVHGVLGVTEPCEECSGFDGVWRGVVERFPSVHHHDSGLATLRGLWAAVRHLRPDVVVETGVARGLSSAVILGALDRNGHGHLWSIDLPQVDLISSGQAKAAVDPALTGRWTYLAGGSRRLLPKVLAEVGEMGLFVHDSLHTASNMRFEMETAWPALAPGGLLVVDDAADNAAFVEFSSAVGLGGVLCRQGNRSGAVGLLRKP